MKHQTLSLMRSLRESPEAKEAAIRIEQRIAESDPKVRDFVRTFHFDADRADALERFLQTPFPGEVIEAIRRHFGTRRDIRICEVGAGDGFLAVALSRAGYQVEILEPSSEYITGTGFLRGLPDAERITIYNDLDAWYASDTLYDLILTNACIHHFDNPHVVAAQIRLKTADKGIWLAFTEYCAFDYEDTLSQLNEHRHAVLYRLYEWPYHPSLYAAMLVSAGFKRREIFLFPSGQSLASRAAHSVWGALCSVRLSWLAYGLTGRLVQRFARGRLRLLDPSYMAFQARPVRWSAVRRGYISSETVNPEVVSPAEAPEKVQLPEPHSTACTK